MRAKPEQPEWEDYIVNLDYQKPDGYWVMSHKEYVTVKITADRKCNHNLAAEKAKQRFPNCRINSVTYQ